MKNKHFKIMVLAMILANTLSSCMVTKCRYSSGWKLDLGINGRDKEYGANKPQKRKAHRNFSAVPADTACSAASAIVSSHDTAVTLPETSKLRKVAAKARKILLPAFITSPREQSSKTVTSRTLAEQKTTVNTEHTRTTKNRTSATLFETIAGILMAIIVISFMAYLAATVGAAGAGLEIALQVILVIIGIISLFSAGISGLLSFVS